MRIYRKFISWIKNTIVDNYPCAIQGHNIREINGRQFRVAHQKGGVRPVLNYFDGIFSICMRPGCQWESYSGNRRPYFREIIGENNHGNRLR